MRHLIVCDGSDEAAVFAEATRGQVLPEDRIIVLSSRGGFAWESGAVLSVPLRWALRSFGLPFWVQRRKVQRAITLVADLRSARFFGGLEDLLLQIEACDPDIIDLSRLGAFGKWLRPKCASRFPGRTVLVRSDEYSREQVSSWRAYDRTEHSRLHNETGLRPLQAPSSLSRAPAIDRLSAMKIAYIVSAYKYPRQLSRLIRALNTPNSIFMVHVDKKTNLKDYNGEFPRGYQPFFGSSYWCLTRECVTYVNAFVRENPDFVDFFKHLWIPDELFFQTIILNSPFKNRVVNDNLRCIDWSRCRPGCGWN